MSDETATPLNTKGISIHELGVTFTSLTPTHFMMLLDVPEAERGDAGFGRVEKLMISSAPARAAESTCPGAWSRRMGISAST